MTRTSRLTRWLSAGLVLTSLAIGAPVSAQESGAPKAKIGALIGRASVDGAELRFEALQAPLVPPPPSGAAPDVPVEPREPRLRTPGLLIGGGLAVVGAGIGLGFSVAALGKNSAAVEERNALAFHTLTTQTICPDHASSTRCAPLRGLVEARDTYRNVAIAGFLGAGLGLGVALFSAVWGPSQSGAIAREPRTLSIVPSRQGVLVTGTF